MMISKGINLIVNTIIFNNITNIWRYKQETEKNWRLLNTTYKLLSANFTRWSSPTGKGDMAI